MEPFQLADVFIGQEIAAHGQHLAELEEHDAEFLEREAHLHRIGPVAAAADRPQQTVAAQHAENGEHPGSTARHRSGAEREHVLRQRGSGARGTPE